MVPFLIDLAREHKEKAPNAHQNLPGPPLSRIWQERLPKISSD
jgi:hypothetical protein